MNQPRTIDETLAHPLCTGPRRLYGLLMVEFQRGQSPVVCSAMEHAATVGGKFANYCGSGDHLQLEIARGAAFALVSCCAILGLYELDAKRISETLDEFITT